MARSVLGAALAAGVILLVTLVGCSPAPRLPVASTSPVDRAAAVQQLLDELSTAAARDDRAAFDRTVAAGVDPAGLAAVWYANLRTLGDELQLRATSSETVPGAGVRARFADQAWLQQITAAWRAPGGTRVAEARIWLTVVADDGRALLADDADAPAADRGAPRPLWLQTGITIERRGAVTVVGAEGVRLGLWRRQVSTATAAVREGVAGMPGPRWDGAVILEVPATQASFERSIGVADGSYARIGAVAWPRGSQARTAAVQIVVNPGVTDELSAEGLKVLLTHEVTHVATRSFASAAPTWLVEGFADQIAYDAHPATRSAALQPLRAAVRRGWVPSELPPESAFEPSAADLDLSYAQAWSLCRLIADRYSDAALRRLYADTSAGTSVPDALRALGTSESGLLADWRAALR